VASKSINVKVPTARLIKALETKLVQIQKNKANEKSNEAKYNKAVETWRTQVSKSIPKTLKPSEVTVGHRIGYGENEGKVSVKLEYYVKPAAPKPERDWEQMNDWQYKEAIETIENAIRVLKLTDDEVVSTSAYKSISEYL